MLYINNNCHCRLFRSSLLNLGEGRGRNTHVACIVVLGTGRIKSWFLTSYLKNLNIFVTFALKNSSTFYEEWFQDFWYCQGFEMKSPLLQLISWFWHDSKLVCSLLALPLISEQLLKEETLLVGCSSNWVVALVLLFIHNITQFFA